MEGRERSGINPGYSNPLALMLLLQAVARWGLDPVGGMHVVSKCTRDSRKLRRMPQTFRPVGHVRRGETEGAGREVIAIGKLVNWQCSETRVVGIH